MRAGVDGLAVEHDGAGAAGAAVADALAAGDVEIEQFDGEDAASSVGDDSRSPNPRVVDCGRLCRERIKHTVFVSDAGRAAAQEPEPAPAVEVPRVTRPVPDGVVDPEFGRLVVVPCR